MRIKVFIAALCALTLTTNFALAQNDTESAAAATTTENEKEGFNPGAEIIEHISDAHEWHIMTLNEGQPDEKHISIPLPIILYNTRDGKLDVFMSSKFHHGEEAYKGYTLVGGGTEAQEIAYADENGNPIVDETGAYLKPLDFSITKVAFSVMIASLILLLILFGVKRSCIKNAGKAPKGMQSLMEILILFIRDGVVVPIIGEKHYQRYLPYILTLFLFIFLCNLIGLVPFFPGGVNVTGNIAITGVLAVITFLITTFSGNKHYWKDIFNTPGVPWWLKFPLPIMPLVEFVGMFTKPFVLMVRLFANITAGHIVTLGFIFLIFIFGNTMSAGVGYAVSPVSVIFSLFISALECLVAFIQAYVFAMLTSLYIGMAVHNPEEEHA
ncbi:MAG: F0F1 ATP synthase subunit A [Bacteroidales bacterium]|nr:F0F1 ATP synthase subunit A [Bacteroidales bacterium]